MKNIHKYESFLNESIKESIVKDAEDILYAISKENVKGYDHLFQNIKKEIERASGDMDVYNNLEIDMDKAAYVLGLIMIKNYGNLDKLKSIDLDELFQTEKPYIAGTITSLVEKGIDGLIKKAKR